VRIAPFSNRLANSVPFNIHALRCLANYEALRFSVPIRIVADHMVDRMIKKSSLTGGKYMSVHLRFEKVLTQYLLLFNYCWCIFTLNEFRRGSNTISLTV
jgi:hypothetical protein